MYKIKDEKNQINKYLDHFSERENEKLELFLIVGQYVAWFKKWESTPTIVIWNADL